MWESLAKFMWVIFGCRGLAPDPLDDCVQLQAELPKKKGIDKPHIYVDKRCPIGFCRNFGDVTTVHPSIADALSMGCEVYKVPNLTDLVNSLRSEQ